MTITDRSATTRISLQGDPRKRGFTLVEMVFVILLLGVMFSFAIPRLNGLTPRYRMRTCARSMAGTIEQMRVIAIARGKSTGIRYVLSGDPQFFQPIKPTSSEYPDEPLHERRSPLREEVPPGVIIRGVILPGNSGGIITDGAVNIGFSPNGTTGSHIVILEAQVHPNEPPEILSMKFNSISGVLDYYNHEVDFQHHDS